MSDKLYEMLISAAIVVVLFMMFAQPLGNAIHVFIDAVQGNPVASQTEK